LPTLHLDQLDAITNERTSTTMSLDPDAETLLAMIRAAGRPPFETLSPAEARRAFAAGRAATQPEPQDVAEVRDLSCPGPLGDIKLRAYRPLGTRAEEILPALVYFHGGGWLLGDLDSHDAACRHYANRARCRVVSVDYRMAPEHKFPAAVDDSAAATRWTVEQAGRLGIDPARVAVGGDSAGGNLAAVLAIMARDGDLPPLAYQLLVYPATDMAMVTRSSQTASVGILTTKTMKWFTDHYIRGPKDVSDWRASPLRAANLSGVAQALVLTCSYDPLCDEGIAYARRLEREGVRVTHLHFSDQTHGFVGQGKIIRAAHTALDMMSAALKKALWPPA
jgi:acetyl esterase/lipase